MVRQLVLPLDGRTALGREDFIAAPGNENALAFLERWPNWPSRAAAIFGPEGSGKTHLAAIWAALSGAQTLSAADVNMENIARSGPHLVIEDVDALAPTLERDAALVALFDRPKTTLLLTGRAAPAGWDVALADLTSRFNSTIAFPVWAPDDTLLAGLVRKLFADRQLGVSEGVVGRMVSSLERTPAAIREFVTLADKTAMAEKRAVTERLVLELLAENSPENP